jgi:HAD superfamily hydrolase (TIGR01459 family)
MQKIQSLSAIIADYDAVLLDLWGVVHDGSQLYPGAKEAMQQLKAAGKQIMLVSNAPRRAAKAQVVLRQLGVADELYDHIITSGEMGYRWLSAGGAGWGKRYVFIGPGRDSDVLDGLDYVRTEALSEADFLLNVGFGSETDEEADMLPLLREAIARRLPMLCLNPDLEVVKITGERYACAGVIAAQYEALGGQVTYFGKPHPQIYDYCMDYLRQPARARVLAIGDGLHTDIAGAQAAGLGCLFVTGGIFKDKGLSLDALLESHGLKPCMVAGSLSW